MSLEYITKKDKIQRCVINVLSTFYGKPTWLEKPKEGQDSELVLKEWISALGNYSEEALKKTSYGLYKIRKAATFPSLSVFISALTEDKIEVKHNNFFCIESELMARDERLGKPFYTLGHYRRAVNFVLDKMLKERLGEESYKKLEALPIGDASVLGRKYQLSIEFGLFDTFDDLLEKSRNREL